MSTQSMTVVVVKYNSLVRVIAPIIHRILFNRIANAYTHCGRITNPPERQPERPLCCSQFAKLRKVEGNTKGNLAFIFIRKIAEWGVDEHCFEYQPF